MKRYFVLLPLILFCSAALAQSKAALDSIAARYHHGFLEINYDENGKPDIDTVALRVYDEQREQQRQEALKNCSCNPFNIAKRMKEARDQYNSLTPAQLDSLNDYYNNVPLFDLPTITNDSTTKPLYDPGILNGLLQLDQPL